MARTTYITLVEDPHRGDQVPLARIAERYDLPANTVSWRYRSGKRGLELIKPRDERRVQRHKRRHVPTACNRQAIIAAALESPGVRQLLVSRLADLAQALESEA